MSVAFRRCASITTVSALVSLGYATAALRASSAASNAGRTPSMYAFARSLALATTAVAASLERSVAGVEATALAMVLVQASDAVIGAVNRDRLKTYGPAATAVLNGAALIQLRRL
jgi:hypothetical protein